MRQVDVGMTVSRASDVPECKFNALIAPSYGAITFEFINRSEYDAWVASISHWTNNSATHGIDTVTQIVPGEGDKPPLEIRFMDFAGQEECVLLYAIIFTLISLADTSERTNTS